MFADIAFTEHPAGRGEMVERNPLPLERKYFKPSNQIAGPIIEPAYGQKLKQFEKDLKSMREKYAPFMKNYTPNAKVDRERRYIKEFQFRYMTEEDNDFSNVLEGKGEWEEVIIPDYRGPVGKEGKWTGFYRTEFVFNKTPGKRVHIIFKAVDYIANVYLNNKCIGSHEGFFAPFEFDITDTLKENNILLVEVKNDYTSLGVEGNLVLDGDKLYGATGPGWDDPLVGWHHCPPGAGIHDAVYIEERSDIYVHDIFVRPDIDDDSIEVWADIYNSQKGLMQDFSMDIAIYGRNTKEGKKVDITYEIPYAGSGINYYRYKIPFTDYRLWDPESPWLYTARITIKNNDEIMDIKDRYFGMRKFHSDETNEPKGRLYLNNHPVILRGANEMGHLQQCVMQDNFEQLIDDILIAKMANMNFYRVTQRPVQEEIYDYFDMLGMMHQCDFPLFGTLRRNQYYEAIRQVGEMERLIRSHPSSIMVTFINEPVAIRTHEDPNHKYNRRFKEKGHRHLLRKDLESFFDSARSAIALENPDRLVKNVEGDYDPPTARGLSDFHIYCMWYTNHAMPIGKFYKGYLPALKEGWKAGCGEYGTEGLDSYDMMQRYPEEWLPKDDNDIWFPDKIVRGQTWGMHGDWFEEQDNIKDWICESQKHQALATGLMTDALRRRSDLIVSTAIHLLIDAWPSGWMKTLVGADRVPKPAYFVYQKSLEPIRVNLRGDQWKAYCGEDIEVEAWVLNDTPEEYEGCKIIATLRDQNSAYGSFEICCDVKETSSVYSGSIKVKIPNVPDRTQLSLDACLINSSGDKINEESFKIEAFQKTKPKIDRKVAYLGSEAHTLLYRLDINGMDLSKLPSEEPVDTIVISSRQGAKEYENNVLKHMDRGSKIIFIRENGRPLDIEVGGKAFKCKAKNPVYFAAINREVEMMQDFRSHDFAYLYNAELDIIDFTADSYIDSEEINPFIFTYRNKRMENMRKTRVPIVGTVNIGRGKITLCNLPLEGKVGYNPILDRFMSELITAICITGGTENL